MKLEKVLAVRTVHHVHTVLGACLKVAVRKDKLPSDALTFPNAPGPGEAFSFTACEHRGTSHRNSPGRRALGFKRLRFHDLRGTHETMLLDALVPVHVVAARCGHDPAVLLRSYAKRTRKADTSAAAVIGGLSRGILTSRV